MARSPKARRSWSCATASSGREHRVPRRPRARRQRRRHPLRGRPAARCARCGFFDNQKGLLTGNDATAELDDRPTAIFADAPHIPGGLLAPAVRRPHRPVLDQRQPFPPRLRGPPAEIARPRVRHHRQPDPRRPATAAPRTRSTCPTAASPWCVGNMLGAEPAPQNPVMLAYGAEGRPWERNALYLSHNTLRQRRAGRRPGSCASSATACRQRPRCTRSTT